MKESGDKESGRKKYWGGEVWKIYKSRGRKGLEDKKP